MKIHHHPLQSNSLSTLERDKKFQRKSSNRQSRSISSRSDSQSLSKFFVRNLQTVSKPQKIDQIINKNIKNNLNWSPPRRQATPQKTQVQKRILLSKQQYINVQTKQIGCFKEQITKYKNYTFRQTEKLKMYVEQNKKLRQQINVLKQQIQEKQKQNFVQQQKINTLNQTIHQKQAMLDFIKKQQPSLQKVKTNIFQTRMNQFQKQRQQLNCKITQLQKTIEDMKSNSMIHCPSQPRESFNSSNILDKSIISQDQYSIKIQKQLYRAKQQIKRLQIAQSCIKRKCYKELQVYKQKRDKQYQELKKKFSEFLSKYKLTMKRFATFQVRNAMLKQEGNKKQRSSSLQSQISLTLSQDQDHK